MPQDVALEVKKKADGRHTLNQDHVKADVSGNWPGYGGGLTVIEVDPNLRPETLDSIGLAIPAKIALSLPQSVRNQLATMAKRDQEARSR
jgi:hypothetical protein